MQEIKASAPMKALKWISRKYPTVFSLFDGWHAEKNPGEEWPHEKVYIPISASVEFLKYVQDQRGIVGEYLNITDPSVKKDLALLSALSGWRPAKNIYNFAPELTEELYRQAKSDKIELSPTLLQLPYWSIYIRPGVPEKFNGAKLDGFFAFFDYFEGRYELHFVPMLANGEPIVGGFYILIDNAGGTIDEQIQRTIFSFQGEDFSISSAENGANEERVKKEFCESMANSAEGFARWVSLILYLSASNAEVKPAFSTPFKRTKTIKDVPREVEVLNVGRETAARIITLRKTAAASAPSEPQGGTHRSPVMHLRRAHWHTFYTGSKSIPLAERKTVLHWLPPVIVNADGEELPETIIRVK